MLKKAGIVVAAAAAGLLALSPLAFADDGHHHHHGDDSVHLQKGGLINVQDVGVQVPIQACNNTVLGGVLGILSHGQHNEDSHDGKCAQRTDNE